MDHVRIDQGIKRGKRQMRKDAREHPVVADRTQLGQFTSKYSPEQRKAILSGVKDAILSGKTTTQIAEEHGIPKSTLKSWIVGDDSIESARGAMLAAELMQRAEQIDTADNPLALACAREGFRAWSWIAERRESRLYGQKQELTVSVTPVLTINTKPVIEGESHSISTVPV